jgi:hypothetical protein
MVSVTVPSLPHPADSPTRVSPLMIPILAGRAPHTAHDFLGHAPAPNLEAHGPSHHHEAPRTQISQVFGQFQYPTSPLRLTVEDDLGVLAHAHPAALIDAGPVAGAVLGKCAGRSPLSPALWLQRR